MRTLPRFLGVMTASAVLALGLVGVASSQSRGVSWLGVYSQEITPELRDGLNYNGDGVLIQRVVPDSPADDAGLRRGDVITRVGGRTIDTPNELASVIRGYSPGRTVEIQFVRDGRRQTADVRLQTRRDDDSEMSAPPVPPVPRVAPTPRVEVHRWDNGDEDDDHDRGHDDADKDDDDVMRDLHGMRGLGALPGMRMQMLGRGRLGVRVESLNPDLASYFGSRDTRGALVIEVVDESPADKADLHPGDVITRLDDTRIESAEDLVKAIAEREEGEVRLSFIRHGQRETAEITLRAAPQVMRLRTPGMSWQDGNGRTRVYRGPEGTKRIVIRDDKSGKKDDAQLRDEIQELKKELEQLRRELDEEGNGSDEER